MDITKKKKILIPLDGSRASLSALLLAKGLAEFLEITLSVLHISDEELTNDELIQKLKLNDSDLSKIMLIHKKGIVEDVIVEEAQNANLIIMCSHGESCDMSKIAGSTAFKVMEKSNIPLIIVKPDVLITIEEEMWRPKKVLIPLNGSPGASQALIPVYKILAKTRPHVDVLHISRTNKQFYTTGSFTAPFYEDYQHHEWSSWTKEFVKRFCETLKKNHSEINLKLTLSTGDPAENILKFARENEIDFIALAWHGELGHLRAQTLKKVLFEAPCPILLVKIKTEQNESI